MAETTLVKPIIGLQLNEIVGGVLTSKDVAGFEKSYLIANAISELKKLLTAQYMKPIMELQGNKLGFKTDKDASGGYSEEIVKNCLIEAVLTGVQPFGNQFNIIAGNCYITKEGFWYLLSKETGLTYEIIPMLPRINADKTSAAIIMKIEWVLKGVAKNREIDFPVKVNQYMGADAVIGKATRKSRAWLYNSLNDTEISDGDTSDIEYKLVQEKGVGQVEKFNEKLLDKKAKEELKAGDQASIV